MFKIIQDCRCHMTPTFRERSTKSPDKVVEVIVTKRAQGCYHKLGDVVLHRFESELPEAPPRAPDVA